MRRRFWPSAVLLPTFLCLAIWAHLSLLPGDAFARSLHLCRGCESGPVGWINATASVYIWGPLILVLAGWLFFFARKQQLALLLLIAEVSTEVLTLIVKALVGRDISPSFRTINPNDLEHLIAPGFFPSGHVMRVTVTLGVLVAGLAWGKPSWRVPAVLIYVFALVALGISRVVTHDHWPSDVVGAYLLGGVWLDIMLFGLAPRLQRAEWPPGSESELETGPPGGAVPVAVPETITHS